MMRALLFAATLVAATPVMAETAPDAATLAAARELMQVTDVRGQMRELGPRTADAMGQQMRQMFNENEMPPGLSTQLSAAMQAFVGSMDSLFTPELIDRIAVIYARHFTADELRRVTVMMKDPVMLKFRAEMPGLVVEMMPMTFEAMKPQQKQFQERIRQIITDWMKQHPEDKAKLRSPTAS